MIGVHAAQTAASMAIEGHYTNARASSLAQQRLVQRWRSDLDMYSSSDTDIAHAGCCLSVI